MRFSPLTRLGFFFLGAVLIFVISVPLNIEAVLMPILMKRFGWPSWKICVFSMFWGTAELGYYWWYLRRLKLFLVDVGRDAILKLWHDHGFKYNLRPLLSRVELMLGDDSYQNHWLMRWYQWAGKYRLGKILLIIIAIIPWALWPAIACAKILVPKYGFWLVAVGNNIKLAGFAYGVWPILLPYAEYAILLLLLVIAWKAIREWRRSRQS